MDSSPVTIVGSGLAGTLLACYLARAGRAVDLYEKRPDPRLLSERGRSINLALSVRGIHALQEVGVAEEVLRTAIAMPGRMIHAPDGSLHFQPYGKDPSRAIHSVSRAGLNIALLNALERLPGVRIFFQHRCVGLDLDTTTLRLQDEGQQRTIEQPCRMIIAADGAFSAVRFSLQRQERFDFSQEYLSHGYKELGIPPGRGGDFQMEPHALHIWPRQRFMLIALPNHDRSFTCTLFLPYEGEPSFESLQTPEALLHFFRKQFPDAVPLMPTLQEDFFHNPTGSLVTIRCRPWHHQGKVMLIGDAAHAVVPFLGQGMNAAFEDCSTLARCLKENPDPQQAFKACEAGRKEHTDTLADLAIANYVEMRDHTGSRLFLLRKKAELLLHKLLGEWYVPLYTLVSFTRTPYADAVRRARRQKHTVALVLVMLLLLVLIVLVWR